ncbi:MAG TPA: DUF3267 domain-containing protein [Anaerolineales bacterium]|nr:DUF3267 domain-containing protein [Anaerolineales bacterium]
MENRRDLSVSMLRANGIVIFVTLPVVVLQFLGFAWLHGVEEMKPGWNPAILIVIILLGIVLHELVHALTWMLLGNKPFASVKFGFQWKTITPYAHLKEPIAVTVYRIATFMPGLLLGILPYLFSLLLADGNLFWFGLFHTSAAGGDWLILWLLRNVRAGSLVEDHPTNAGCYVIEA